MSSAGEGVADRVRRHAIESYIRPARQRGAAQVAINVGDVARALRLQSSNLYPAICGALKTKRFLEREQLEIASVDGPASGQSSTVTYLYRLGPGPAAPSEDWFNQLRGLFRGMYDDAGGGEAWLRREREDFGGPNDK